MSDAHTRWLGAAALAALVFGCSEQNEIDSHHGTGGVVTHPDAGSEPDSGTPPVTCSKLASVFDLPVGAGGIGLQTDLAADFQGNVVYAGAGSVTKFSPEGLVAFTKAYGSVVAVDRVGNTYVAGSFTGALDVGFGTMVPDGNIDTFIVKLSIDGTPLFARQLHVCGDGLRSIAVAEDGRIALSGTALGTLVLDKAGNVLLSYTFSGAVAFDSKGNLVVAGSFSDLLDLGPGNRFENAGDGDAFIAKIDDSGHVIFSKIIGDPQLPLQLNSDFVVNSASSQTAVSVAVDANDNIVVLGHFFYDADVLGETQKAFYVASQEAAESIHSSAFVVKLDAAGDVMMRKQLTSVAIASDLALDASGNIYVNGAVYNDASGPYRTNYLIKLDSSGGYIAGGEQPAFGSGHSLAVDPCGNLFQSRSVRLGSPLVPFDARLIKSQF